MRIRAVSSERSRPLETSPRWVEVSFVDANVRWRELGRVMALARFALAVLGRERHWSQGKGAEGA